MFSADGAVYPGIIKPFCNYLSVSWACTHFVSKFFISNRVSYPECFSQINKNSLTSICKRLHCNVLVCSVPTSVSSLLRMSPHTPFSARRGGRYLQIKMYVVSGPTTENVLSIPELCFHAIIGKILSHSFPGRLVWTKTLGQQLFFMCFWPFKQLIFLKVFILLSLQAFLLYHESNEKNNQTMRFSSYSVIK